MNDIFPALIGQYNANKASTNRVVTNHNNLLFENIIENYGTLTIIDSIGGGVINGNIDNHGTLNR